MDNVRYLCGLVWLLLWFTSVPAVGRCPTESHTVAMLTPVGHAPWKWLWGTSMQAFLLGFCQFVSYYVIYLFNQKQIEEDCVFSVGELSSLSVGGAACHPWELPQDPLGAALPAALVGRACGKLSAEEKCWCSESSESCWEHPSALSWGMCWLSLHGKAPDSTGRQQCHLGSVVVWALLLSDTALLSPLATLTICVAWNKKSCIGMTVQVCAAIGIWVLTDAKIAILCYVCVRILDEFSIIYLLI